MLALLVLVAVAHAGTTGGSVPAEPGVWLPCNFGQHAYNARESFPHRTIRAKITAVANEHILAGGNAAESTWVFQGELLAGAGQCGAVGSALRIHVIRTLVNQNTVVPKTVLKSGKNYFLEGHCSVVDGKPTIFYLNPCGPSFEEGPTGAAPDSKGPHERFGHLAPPLPRVNVAQNELVIFFEETITSWSQDSHRARAEGLKDVYPGSIIVHLKPTTDAAKYPGLKTAVFWGHGDASALCGKTPKAMFGFIKRLQQRNQDLESIELITCDARHDSYASREPKALKDQAMSLAKQEPNHKGLPLSYADKLLKLLRADDATKQLLVKALPVSVHGKAGVWSRLYANTFTKTWAYVANPGSEMDFLQVAKLIKEFLPGEDRGAPVDLAQHCQYQIKAHPQRLWSAVYGTFRTLRRVLVTL